MSPRETGIQRDSNLELGGGVESPAQALGPVGPQELLPLTKSVLDPNTFASGLLKPLAHFFFLDHLAEWVEGGE